MKKLNNVIDKITDILFGTLFGATIGFAGGFLYSIGDFIYKEFSPTPINREYRKLENDINVQTYNQLRQWNISEFMKKPELLEKIITLHTNPQVNRYGELANQINEYNRKCLTKNVLQIGIPLGGLGGAIFGIYHNRYKRKRKT